MSIRVLSPAVAARIAAGEVIERPASIVKELIENALDAGASKISVEITGGGIDSIRVTDDGCGIDPADLPTAFQRHATSKLQSDEDLARILTLGFRGEALPSIAAVGEVEMVSRTPNAESAAFLRLTPDVEPETGVRGAAIGTSISVRGVFARMPARRSFLRSTASETSAVSQAVSHYALAYPEVRWSLTVDARRTLETSGSGDIRDAVAAVYGPDTAAAMIALHSDNGDTPAVTGLIAPPHISRSTRAYVSLFVNRRWIQNRRLTHAVEEAYQGLLMVGRHPLAVLNLRVPPEEVDVNVHPTKAEVRFRDEGAVFGLVQKRVRGVLVASSPVPAMSGAPGLQLTPGSTTPPLWDHALRVERRGSEVPVLDSLSVGRVSNPTVAGPALGTPQETLPALRVIGRFGNIYIIAEGPDGIFLIDQHAAHERVLYDRFCRERLERSVDVQGLLEPAVVDLSPAQRAAIAGNEQVMREYGFDFEAFGDGSYVLRSLPASLAAGEVRPNVAAFLDSLVEEPEGDRRDRVAMSLACHGAIRAGKQLAMEEMRDLVRQLEATDSPHTCPHGRPTMIHMGVDALAREFGRR